MAPNLRPRRYRSQPPQDNRLHERHVPSEAAGIAQQRGTSREGVVSALSSHGDEGLDEEELTIDESGSVGTSQALQSFIRFYNDMVKTKNQSISREAARSQRFQDELSKSRSAYEKLADDNAQVNAAHSRLRQDSKNRLRTRDEENRKLKEQVSAKDTRIDETELENRTLKETMRQWEADLDEFFGRWKSRKR